MTGGKIHASKSGVVLNNSSHASFNLVEFGDNQIGVTSMGSRAELVNCTFQSHTVDILLHGSRDAIEISGPDAPTVSVENTFPQVASDPLFPSLSLLLAASLVGFIIVLRQSRLLEKALIFPLFSRISKSSLLLHPTRQQIYEVVKDEPGIHFRALARVVGSYGKAQYHTSRLEDSGLLASRKVGQRKQFYLVGSTPEVEDYTISEQIYAMVVECPGIPQNELRDKLSVSRQVISYNVNKLEAKAKLKSRSSGRTKVLFPHHPTEQLE